MSHQNLPLNFERIRPMSPLCLDPAGDIDAERGVVDRQRPADRFDAGELRHPRVRHHAQRRQRRFGHPIEHLAVVLVADRAHGDAARRRLELHLGHRGHHVGELRPAERAVQHRHVVGIDHVLEMLQPVAGNDGGAAAAESSCRRPRRIRRRPSFPGIHSAAAPASCPAAPYRRRSDRSAPATGYQG